MLIDTHCHLDFGEFDQDRDEVLARAKQDGVGTIINVGSSLEGSLRSVELAKKYRQIYAVVGVHPHEADNPGNDILKEIERIALEDKVVAIGEIGLDYFKNFSKKENQRPLFISFLELARKLNLPVVIHSRQAESDTLEILKESRPIGAVVHCFSADANFLRSILELGFYVSFTCNMTYPKAQGLRDIIKTIPLDRLMLETDAPYLSPEGLRGKRNEPANVKILAQEIAKIRGIDFQDVCAITTDNAKEFFKIP